MASRIIKTPLLIYMIAGIIFFLDQITKVLIQKKMLLGESIPVIQNVFHITFVSNTGAAFGIFKGQRLLFILISIAVIIGMILLYRKLVGLPLWIRIASGLILGGAIGNLCDRIIYHYVIDFLDFHVWPVFNVADSAITIGAGILLISMLFYPKQSFQKG